MLIFIIILIIALIVVAAVAYALGFFRIEKVELEDHEQDFGLLGGEGPADEEAEGESAIDLDDGVSLKEKMDLNGYFGDGENGEGSKDSLDKAIKEERFAQTDPLSELRVGRGYRIDCQRMLTEARKLGNLYAGAWLDFDRFRFINSLKGMSIGDYVLTNMGHELTEAFPEGSLISRVSADHFTAVFPVGDMDMFSVLSERLQEISERMRGDIGVKSGLRICMGVALTDNTEDYDISVLLHKANVARHCIKTSRNESWKLYENSMLSTYLYGESALDDYNENQYDEEFVIYYAPQQDLSMRNTVGCEAMVRWACEDSSGKGISTNVDKAKIPTNASKVIYQVCKALSRWRKAGKQLLPVSVSVPVTEIYKADVDEFLARCLSEFQLEPSLLCIVVDAPMVRLDWSTISHQLKKIREIGARTGVDEIDLGYTGLDFLSGLPLDFVKLQRGYTHDLQNEEGNQQAARRMLAAAKALNLRVIFEGVDTQQQADCLQELGAQEVQGLYCGRPHSAEQYGQGLPEHIEKRHGPGTVILDDVALSKGDYNLF